MATEEQGTEKGGENIRSNAMKGLPDGVGDGVRSWGGGGRALCEGGGDLFCSACGAIRKGAKDVGEGLGRLRRKKMIE